MNQMFNILVNQLIAKRLAFINLVYHSEIILMVPDFGEEIRITDVHKVPFVIEQGAAEARRHIEYLKRLLVA